MTSAAVLLPDRVAEGTFVEVALAAVDPSATGRFGSGVAGFVQTGGRRLGQLSVAHREWSGLHERGGTGRWWISKHGRNHRDSNRNTSVHFVLVFLLFTAAWML